MTANQIPSELAQAREQFMKLVSELRPELHRYCARITGSVIDGEDVVQDTLAKAYYTISLADELPPLRPWLFRIAHNTAIDFLRRYEHRYVEPVAQLPHEAAIGEEVDRDVVRAALSNFLSLPVLQRSAVILKDVLGFSAEEIADATGSSVPAVKAALIRGRTRLRELSAEQEPPPPSRAKSDAEERARLGRYVSLFNARDWDGVRALLSEECRLDLVSRAAKQGKAVGQYFGRYANLPDLRFVLGTVEGRSAIGVYANAEAERPEYFILLEWRDDKVALIRDYRYVPYIASEAEFIPATAAE